MDGNTPTRYKGSKSTTPIELQISVGKHYVKIVPHNWVMVGRARCIGNGSYNNYRNTDLTKLEFGLEWLPWYAFMMGEMDVGLKFLYYTWAKCTTITSMPAWFNLPQGITRVKFVFANFTRFNCTSLTSDSPAEPLTFPNVKSGIYASNCFWGSCPISPDAPAPWSSVMIKRNS